MPHIQVTLVKGRTTEQKRRLPKRLTDVLSEEAQVDSKYISLISPSRWWKLRLTVLRKLGSWSWTGEGVKVEAKWPAAAGLSLSRGSLLRLEGICKGVWVRCFSGALWVTQEGDFEDHFLDSGEKFVINRGGLVAVQVLEDACITIEQGRKSCSLSLTLVNRKHLNGGPL